MANKLRLDPELTKIVERARRQAAASGELTPVRPGRIEPLPPEVQQVLRDWIDSGEFAATVAAIGAEDPDLADQPELLAAACEQFGIELRTVPF